MCNVLLHSREAWGCGAEPIADLGPGKRSHRINEGMVIPANPPTLQERKLRKIVWLVQGHMTPGKNLN